ncbi:MAG: hypothetical protein J2P41_12310, partial [Blastocatellia bacterium]|nr:hypothetical protein [Blastocatellia bacterium]
MSIKLIRMTVMALLLAGTATYARSQSEEDARFLMEVYKNAAFLQSSVDVCREHVPAADADNQQAYAAWQKRNQWEVLSPLLKRDERLREVYEQTRQSVRALFLSLMEKSSPICQQLPTMMKQPALD